MNVVFGFCMFSDSSLLFRAENWAEIRSKIAPIEFCRLCRSHMSRDRVVHADASSALFPLHAFASSTLPRHLRFPIRAAAQAMRPRRCDLRSFARSREPCDRVTSRWLSPQILVFLLFLLASSPISLSFMPYKA